MTPLSRRAFVTAATASLLAGCAGRAPDRTAPAARRRTASSPPPSAGTATAGSAAHALGRSTPVRLRIPAIRVDTPLLRLGLAADGTVQVPPVTAHDRAGWYRYSPTPGQTGPSVILGHVTVGAYGDGVFRRLAELRRGEQAVARLENGRSAVFTVDEVRTVAKSAFPTRDVYGDVDRPELRLITCGGPRGGDGYLDNVIVFATLTGTTP
ncbi:MAG: class F sortase [Streptomyces sp.]|uniref:class F sortase n=1 Tax=Streptomyces sp. TaxID=1931 RepID=UPI0025F7B472|nr:class F sortase [Streptomyces sp.]MBW8793325.1 class F sortase [Streptomyces sp.]